MNLIERLKNLTQYGPGAAAAAAGAAAGSTSGISAAGVGSTVASGVAGGIGLISSIGNIIQNYKAREQNQSNWRETFNYQKELNQILMNREDTAVQRRQADLAEAGINPMLAGLGGASATPGGIINPLQQQSQPIDANGAIQGLTSMSGALGELERIKSSEKLAADNKEAQLELQRREIEASKLSDEAKYAQEKELQWIKGMQDLIRDRLNARDNAEQRKLDRDLELKIATHRAIRELFKNSEIPGLSTIWENFGDVNFIQEDGKLDFGKFKKYWDDFMNWREENLKRSLGFKKHPDGSWRDEEGKLWGKASNEIKKGQGRGF